MSNYTTTFSLRILLLLMLAFAGQALFAQTKTWTNGAMTGNWEDAGNWSPAGAPTATSRVVFDNTSSANCTINSDPTVERLTIDAAYTGNVNLGSNELTISSRITVDNASGFTSGMGSKVIMSGGVATSRVDCAASIYDLEINTASAGNSIRFDQVLNITNDLTVTQVGAFTGSDVRVGGNILITDPNLSNTAFISATGSGTLSGTQMRRLNVEAGASLQLISDLTLNNDFDLTGSGMVTGSNKFILGSDGSLDFAGSVSNVEISNTGQNISLSQPFNISGDLTITQIGSLNGNSEMRVGGNITSNDPDMAGTSFIVATGSGNLSGSGILRRLRVEPGASLALPSDFTLANNFNFAGGGTITGAGKLVFGSNGTVNFSGTVSNVEISTAQANQSITFSQNFNITDDLSIAQVSSLNGTNRQVRVGGDINVTDAVITGSASLVLAGSGTTSFQGSGGGSYRRLVVDKDNATDIAQLNSSDDFHSITVNEGILDLNGQSPTAPVTINSGGTLSGNGTVIGNVTVNSGGTLAGNGTVDGDITVNAGGMISPGNSIGTITINGDFTNNGTLNIEIAGPGSFDQIIVNGNAVINGNISITFLNGFAPVLGQVFTIITGAGPKSGSATVSATNAAVFAATYNSATGVLTFNVNVVLPVELISFEADAVASSIQLSWRTATERNNDYMAVERSADGVKFGEIGRVKGAGTTEQPQEYGFVDEHPLPGLNYYRLRQVDFDGAFEYHKTISVAFKGKASSGLNVQAFPNPAQYSLQARWSADSRQPSTLRLFDTSGRLLATYPVDAGADSYEVPVSNLPAGLYFLQASQGGKVEVVQFFKQ